MHLLSVDSLRLEAFINPGSCRYAILSHTWAEKEVSYQDIQEPHSHRTTSLAGFEKIRRACHQAKLDKYQYIWIDTCCIDKSSSAELSEAINSMFQWYRAAGVCYAYLSDVSEPKLEDEFASSRWFSRGWTLQELLAPNRVVFYDRDWCKLGTKAEHANWISKITGIDLDAFQEDFTGTSLGRFCIAKRMSWASKRETTRVEDIAYCLLGIFNIHMPLLYGERERAFTRLQEELIKNYDDDSILAWGLDVEIRHRSGIVPNEVAFLLPLAKSSSILASSPKDFENCRDLNYSNVPSTKPFTLNNTGLQIDIPLIPVYPSQRYYNDHAQHEIQAWVGLLGCSTSAASEFLGVVLRPARLPHESSDAVQRVSYTASHQDRPEWRTVLVGPRAAFEAERKTITIVQETEISTRRERDYTFVSRHFLVNESPALLDTGYVLSYATVKAFTHRGWSTDYYTNWNQWAKSLSIMGSFFRDGDLICFEFIKRHSSDPAFTVLLRDKKAIALEGISIPDHQLSACYISLGEANSAMEGWTLQREDGSRTPITVALLENNLSFSSIIEVYVDIMP